MSCFLKKENSSKKTKTNIEEAQYPVDAYMFQFLEKV